MDRDSRAKRGELPFVFTNLRGGDGVDAVLAWVLAELAKPRRELSRVARPRQTHHHHHPGE